MRETASMEACKKTGEERNGERISDSNRNSGKDEETRVELVILLPFFLNNQKW